ncbi:MAG: hypothetical protein RSE38_13330 [Acinetobacter sp.]
MKDSVLLKPFPDPVCIVSQAVLNIDDTGEIATFFIPNGGVTSISVWKTLHVIKHKSDIFLLD